MHVTDVQLTLLLPAVQRMLMGEPLVVVLANGMQVTLQVDDAVAQYYRSVALASMPVSVTTVQ